MGIDKDFQYFENTPDEENIAQASQEYKDNIRYYPDDPQEPCVAHAFRTGVQWRDHNPSLNLIPLEDVEKLVKYLKIIVDDSEPQFGIDGAAPVPTRASYIAKKALTEFNQKRKKTK